MVNIGSDLLPKVCLFCDMKKTLLATVDCIPVECMVFIRNIPLCQISADFDNSFTVAFISVLWKKLK